MKRILAVLYDEFGDFRVGDFDTIEINTPKSAKAMDPQIEKIDKLKLTKKDAIRDKETYWEPIGIIFRRIKKPKSSE